MLLNDMAREGAIHLLIRGKAEAISGAGTPVLSQDEMRALGQLGASVQKALKGKPVPRTLLRDDVEELLLDLVKPSSMIGPAEVKPSTPTAATSLVDLLTTEAHRLVKPDMGLCFVPDLVLSCLPQYSLIQIHEALLQAVLGRRIELRPESGMNRLSSLELALCPEGLRGSRLSWARPLEPRP